MLCGFGCFAVVLATFLHWLLPIFVCIDDSLSPINVIVCRNVSTMYLYCNLSLSQLRCWFDALALVKLLGSSCGLLIVSVCGIS